MGGLYTLSRIYAGLMGFIILGGILWFSSALSGTIVAAGTIGGVTSLGVSLVPPRKLSNQSIQRTLITLCVIGVGAGLVLVWDDLNASGGIEWDVLSMKALDIVALATMAILALRRSPDAPHGAE